MLVSYFMTKDGRVYLFTKEDGGSPRGFSILGNCYESFFGEPKHISRRGALDFPDELFEAICEGVLSAEKFVLQDLDGSGFYSYQASETIQVLHKAHGQSLKVVLERSRLFI